MKGTSNGGHTSNIAFNEGVTTVTRKALEADARSEFRCLLERQEREWRLARSERTDAKRAAKKNDGCMDYLQTHRFDREYLEILKKQYRLHVAKRPEWISRQISLSMPLRK